MSEKRFAVVTGAARGIGKTILMELLRQGKTAAAIDLNKEQLDKMAAEAKKEGYDVITECLDITDTELLTSTLDKLSSENGGIDILVNNAGITRDKLMMQMDEPDYDVLMNVNLRAAFMACKAVIRPMIRKKFGRIINISSVAGVMGQAGSTNYATSKAGLIGMSKSIVREVGKKGITVNCIAPGFIQTEMTDVLPDAVKKQAMSVIPMKKMGTPEDVANAVAFLASDEAGYISGQVLCVDGGMAM
jgi:3-oxoacyl-[acyl-carrier protein] reductase